MLVVALLVPSVAGAAFPDDYEPLFRDGAGEVVTFDYKQWDNAGILPMKVTSDDRYVIGYLLFDYGEPLPHPDFFCAELQTGCWDLVIYDRQTGRIDSLINELNGDFHDGYTVPSVLVFGITDDLNTFVVDMYCHPGASVADYECDDPFGARLLVMHERDTDKTTVLHGFPGAADGPRSVDLSDDGKSVLVRWYVEGAPPAPNCRLKPCDGEEGAYLWRRGRGWSQISSGGVYPGDWTTEILSAQRMTRDGKYIYLGIYKDDLSAYLTTDYLERYSVADGSVVRWSNLAGPADPLFAEGETVVVGSGALNTRTGVIKELLDQDCYPYGLNADGTIVACARGGAFGEPSPPLQLIEVPTGKEMAIFTHEEGFHGSPKGWGVALGSSVVTLFLNNQADPDAYIYWAWTGQFGFSDPGTGPGASGFTDIAGSVFAADIEWLAATGITRGCNPPVNDRFCPNDSVTRGQMAAFLNRALGLDPGPDTFNDTGGSVFSADIGALAGAGITRGCNPPRNNRFCPTDPVTRGQMAAFLVRALGYTDDGGGDLFVDDNGSVFEGDIDRLGTAGVTRGCNPPVNDRYCPDDPVTRGQMAAFLRRALSG